jgi:ubiquitin-protein ligase
MHPSEYCNTRLSNYQQYVPRGVEDFDMANDLTSVQSQISNYERSKADPIGKIDIEVTVTQSIHLKLIYTFEIRFWPKYPHSAPKIFLTSCYP